MSVLSLFGTGIYEVVAWGLDPLGVHAALNDGQSMNVVPKVASALINGGVWLIFGKYCRSVEVGDRKTLPSWLYGVAPIGGVFTFAQWIFWWWPYLLGETAGTINMQTEHKAQLSQLPRVLPAFGNHLVPDIEHTFLQPLSLLALYTFTCTLASKKISVTRNQRNIFTISSLLFATMQSAFIITSDAPATEIGPMLVVTKILLWSLYVRQNLNVVDDTKLE